MIKTGIVLKKNEERRIRTGHNWIFSNEIEKIIGDPENGSVVNVYSHIEMFLCKAFYNKNSLISLRVLTKDKHEEIDYEYFKKNILRAFDLRNRVYQNVQAFRIVNGESDFLPGLILDKYENKYSVKIYSLGMEKHIDDICNLIKELFKPDLIIAKNDFELRTLEGLERYEKILYQKDENSILPFIIEIEGIKYKIDLISGQKTGFYLDQNMNRYNIRKYIKDDSMILDLFCNEGGFSLNGARAGAKNVLGVDESQISIKKAEENAEINNFTNIKFICQNVFDFLKIHKNDLPDYNFVILDPPSFTKSKKKIEEAKQGYIKLNSSVINFLKPSSFLFTFSCSHHIDEKMFMDILIKSSIIAKKDIQILEFINCSPDHPVLPSMPETKYLKGFLLRIM